MTLAPTQPPGPRPRVPGALLPAFILDRLSLLERVARQYGDIAGMQAGPTQLYLLNHPDYIRDVLVTHSKQFHKGRGLQRIKRLLGEGLLTSEDDFHLRQRRLVQPAFHRQRVNAYGTIMAEYAERQTEQWQDGATLDVFQEMMRLTLAIVAKTLFNTEVASQAAEIGRTISDLIELFPLLFVPFSQFLEKIPVAPPTRKFDTSKRHLDGLIYQIINERRTSGEDKGDLLSMLLLAQDSEGDGKGMNDRQVRDEALTLFLAGHETTAVALTWTWYLLSQHPTAEAKLQAELDSVLGERLPTAEDLPRLPYTEQVFTEAMRLYPPAWIIGRQALNDYRVCGYTIPAGSLVLVSPYIMQRDARYYDKPGQFIPERWTAEFRSALPKFAYFPFGGGPRRCIGEPFAWLEGQLLLATIARRWRLCHIPTHPVALQPQITLRPRYGMQMQVKRRK